MGTCQLLYCYQSAGGAVPHQIDLAEQARPSMTSWLQLSNAGQSLGIAGRTGGHAVSLCGTLLQSFLYICLQLRFRIGPRDLARGSERCGRNSANNLVEPVVFKSRDLNAGNFSQVSWKTGVYVMNLWHVENTYTYTDILTSFCGEKKCWSVECSRWVCRSGTVVIMSPQFKKKVLDWSFCVDLADFLHVPVGPSQTHVRYINCWPHCCPDNVCVGIKNYVPADLKHFLNNI